MSLSKNLRGDVLWGGLLLIWVLILAIPAARTVFTDIAVSHPYPSGFVKFFIMAPMGDLLGMRIRKREWVIPRGLLFKAVLWGIIGMMITLVFTVYSTGAAAAQETGRLPFAGSNFAAAFFASLVMNTTFGPMMYVYHKFGDLFIDAKLEKGRGKAAVGELAEKVDWQTMVSFSWLKTCPLVWLPCHTVCFLLPSEYRVLASAFLSVLLGVLAAVSKTGGRKNADMHAMPGTASPKTV